MIFLKIYIYRSQFSLKHSEFQSDLKFIVLVVSLVFWINIIVWIEFTCAHILDTGLRIPVDLHFRDKDLFDINFVSYLFIYLFIYLFVHLFVCIYNIYLLFV